MFNEYKSSNYWVRKRRVEKIKRYIAGIGMLVLIIGGDIVTSLI